MVRGKKALVPFDVGLERGEGGKFAPRVTDSDVLRALRSRRDPVATAGELATVLGVSSETIPRHLTELHDQGRIGRKEIGVRTVVWWPAVGDRQDGADADVGDTLFDLPTFSGGEPTDASGNVDEHLGAAIVGEGDNDGGA